jgi:hypothetical protein
MCNRFWNPKIDPLQLNRTYFPEGFVETDCAPDIRISRGPEVVLSLPATTFHDR